MEDLFDIASNFRSAIEKAVRAGEIKEMATFPRGCCSFASDLLQRYLIEQYSFHTWYMSGQYGYGWNAKNHAWLESEDCTVIDITGDQYFFSKLKFTEPVYVGPRIDGFHDRFELETPISYSRSEDHFYRQKFDKRYETVIRYLPG